MKKLIILLVLLFSISVFSQSKTILFKKQLKGLIEIDGHTFDNEKHKDPIYFEASLSGIKIYSKEKTYSKRNCSSENCEIIHLTEYYFTSISIGNTFPPTNLLGN